MASDLGVRASLPHSIESAALVRAIRRAVSSPLGYAGLERFTVTDIHQFARQLAAEGIRAREEEP